MKRKFYKDLNLLESMRGTVNDSDDMAAIYDPLLGKGLGDEHNVCAFVAIGDKNAGDLCQLSDDELANAVLARIDEAYDGQGTQNLMGTPIVQNWKAEPYIRGAYTFSCPSRLRKELVKPIGNKSAAVFLAGEHTSPKHYSLVPGAACEGRRAALDVVSSLNLGGK
jgi:monoamine oxidase